MARQEWWWVTQVRSCNMLIRRSGRKRIGCTPPTRRQFSSWSHGVCWTWPNWFHALISDYSAFDLMSSCTLQHDFSVGNIECFRSHKADKLHFDFAFCVLSCDNWLWQSPNSTIGLDPMCGATHTTTFCSFHPPTNCWLRDRLLSKGL